jgi:hypothetical protein
VYAFNISELYAVEFLEMFHLKLKSEHREGKEIYLEVA